MSLGAMVAQGVFWICLALILYAYFLYPLVLFVFYSFSQVRRDWIYLTRKGERRIPSLASEELPSISLLIAAYNEEKHLPAKLANLGQLDYPAGKLDVVFVSDGSTDRTPEILGNLKDSHIQTVLLPERKGKPTALNHAVAQARHEILVLSDATTLFHPEAIKNLVRHFSGPTIGVVCGSLQFQGTSESEQTEGVYWKYESMLRMMEARLGATLTASGAIYAIRRCCFDQLAASMVIEDFIIPMRARKLGYRVIYDPEALATEVAAPDVRAEFTRRVRLAVGSFQALGELARVPLTGFSIVAFVSHKLLRWIVPFLLVGLLASNAFLLAHLTYRIAFVCQMAFYLWAGLGYALRDRLQRIRFALVGYFVLTMNMAFLVGFVHFLKGREEVTWRRVN